MKKFTMAKIELAQSAMRTGTVPLSNGFCDNSEDDEEIVPTKAIAKKTIILYVLKILQQHSSAEHPVSQSAIARYLNDIGIPCDRKTVGRNLVYLKDFGIKLIKVEGKGYYIEKNQIVTV